MANIVLNSGSGGATLATEHNASAPNEDYQIIEIASGAGAAFANRLTITAAGAAKIDSSGTTVQANAGTNLNTSALALETGGNLASILARFPATAALADATTNPTLSAMAGFNMGFNGTTWDRLQVDGSKNLKVAVQTMPTTAVTGTFWQATQPVSGTISEATLDAAIIAQEATTSGVKGVTAFGAVTTAKPSYTTAKSDALSLDTSGLLRVSLADTPANTNKFLVTPDSVALPLHQSVNVDQLNGTTTDTNSGTKSAGTLRVVLATDQPQLTNKLLVTPDSVALPANQSVNVAQINAVTPLMGNGVTGTGSQRVTVASDNTAFKIINTAPSDGVVGWSFNYQSALSSTKAQIKATAGTFGGFVNLFNPNTATTFLQVFNKASANVTVGTTTPDFVITLPGIAAASGTGSDRNLEITNGIAMSTGITVAATTTATGSTAPTNSVVGTFLFL